MNLREITVENFGPIKDGTVELRPLTIFIGPSNSGKSYMATLIYSILSSENPFGVARPRYSSSMLKSIKKELSGLVRHSSGDTIEVPPDITQKMYSLIIQEIFGYRLKQNLERNFLMPGRNLARRGSARTRIKISTFADIVIGLGNDNPKVTKFVPPDTKYVFEISDHVDTLDITKDRSTITIVVGRKSKQSFFKHDAPGLVASAMLSELWKDGVPRLAPFYFPASRSGILETYQETAASIMQDISYSVFTKSKPVVGGIVTDFMTPLITLRRKKAQFFKLAEEMESEVLRGGIGVRIDRGRPPQILYTSDGSATPLDNASSAISELAPLSIYLKYVVQKDGILIIEEPESHLHPSAQAAFAKYIAKMVRAGLKILVTTHSPLLLAEFGKYVLASRLDEKTRRGLKIGAHITTDEVSAHVFRKNRDESYGIERMPFDDENGISQEEFGRVEHELYDQWLEVVSSLPRK